MKTPEVTALLTFSPAPPTRPAEHAWAGPCKSTGCHALRDFIVLGLVSAAIASACVGLGIL